MALMGKKAADAIQYVLMALGIAAGWFGYVFIDEASNQVASDAWWLVALVTIVAAAVGLYLNLILHEAGHLIAGLLSGYRFAAFCVFKTSIVKQDGRLVVRRRGAPGASGLCVLSPPAMRDGTYPVRLYISGGFLMNFILAGSGFGLAFGLAGVADLWARVFLVVGIFGAFLGLVNFIPTNAGGAFSDGYVLFNLGKEENAEARRGCWSVFQTQALDVQGTRPRELPRELYDWVDVERIDNVFVLSAALTQYNSVVDSGDLPAAKALARRLSEGLPDSFATQRLAVRCELLFLELVGECRPEEIDGLYTKALAGYLRAAHADSSVQRLKYAYARLFLGDAAKAAESLAAFRTSSAASVWRGTSRCEEELVALIDAVAEQRAVDVHDA